MKIAAAVRWKTFPTRLLKFNSRTEVQILHEAEFVLSVSRARQTAERRIALV